MPADGCIPASSEKDAQKAGVKAMKILIDADACPVTQIAADIAYYNNIPCVMISDTEHETNTERSEHITVDKGRDSADLRIMNLVQPGDIVITHDFKLALVCLSMGAYVLEHDGRRYDAQCAPKKQAKLARRTEQQDLDFEESLSDLLWEILTKEDEAEMYHAYSD